MTKNQRKMSKIWGKRAKLGENEQNLAEKFTKNLGKF